MFVRSHSRTLKSHVKNKQQKVNYKNRHFNSIEFQQCIRKNCFKRSRDGGSYSSRARQLSNIALSSKTMQTKISIHKLGKTKHSNSPLQIECILWMLPIGIWCQFSWDCRIKRYRNVGLNYMRVEKWKERKIQSKLSFLF